MSAPTVFFIDDSATMREVIKIAFRRENIDVVACHDADAAVAEMQQHKPDVVISDVIMPGKDGYEVCQMIKQSPGTAGTPVILMSGVVNRSVAEKAFAVKADELIRKPFQPQDLITRVRHLLQNKSARADAMPVAAVPAVAAPVAAPVAANGNGASNPDAMAALSSIFSGGAAPARAAQPLRPGVPVAVSQPAMPVAPAAAAVPRTATAVAAAAVPVTAAVAKNGNGSADSAKLKIEVLRLENLVKKLQSELQAERDYARALEEHIKTLQEAE